MINVYRRVALALLGVLGCVAAVDLSLRALAPFELHRDWEHPLIAAKEQLYEKFARSGVDVLLVGSSLSMNLDAKRLSELSGRRVFNGSVAGLTAAGIAAVVETAYTPIQTPKLVIYPLSMRDIRGGRAFQMPPFSSHKMRAVRAPNWQSKIEIAAENASYLFRIRRQLRHSLVSDEHEERIAALDEYGTRGHARHQLPQRLRNRAYARKYFNKLLQEQEASQDTDNAKELVRMIQANRKNGVHTVLVNMTLSPAALKGKQRKRYAKYLKQLEAVAKREGVPLYDALDDLKLSNEYFNDYVHVGAKGDKKVEDYLVRIIRRHLEVTHAGY